MVKAESTEIESNEDGDPLPGLWGNVVRDPVPNSEWSTLSPTQALKSLGVILDAHES